MDKVTIIFNKIYMKNMLISDCVCYIIDGGF